MILHFHHGNVNLFDEDKAYFETKFQHLVKLLGRAAGDDDTVEATIRMEKNKHHSGDRFEASADLTSRLHGEFHAETQEASIRACADALHDKLKSQISRFHDKKVSH